MIIESSVASSSELEREITSTKLTNFLKKDKKGSQVLERDLAKKLHVNIGVSALNFKDRVVS